MASDVETKQLDCETAVDRISNLPGNLIDLILERLPIHDAARMGILSKTWRDIWVTNPYLVFDSQFFSKIGSKKDRETLIFEVSSIISSILLAHAGPISKFLLDIPLGLPLHLHRCRDMSFWIKNISNNRVRKLELLHEALSVYKMPSYLFSCLELTHLTLRNCILNPPDGFEGFCNLISVKLERVKITAGMSFGTQVGILNLTRCTGIGHLGSQFKCINNFTQMIILNSGEIDMRWFRCMPKMTFFGLVMDGVTNFKNEIPNLDKLLGSMPIIKTLRLGGFFIKSLEPCGAVLKRPMTTLKDLSLFRVGFHNMVHIQHVLCLIRSSPNLRNLRIELDSELNSSDDMDLMVLPVDMILEQLEYIEILEMVGSETEFQFIKILLSSAPSLKLIELNKNFEMDDTNEELRIVLELLQFPRASPTAQIKWY